MGRPTKVWGPACCCWGREEEDKREIGGRRRCSARMGRQPPIRVGVYRRRWCHVRISKWLRHRLCWRFVFASKRSGGFEILE